MDAAFPIVMLKTGLGATIALSLVVILVLWLAGNAFGFHVSLFGSVVLSIALTVILNLILRAGNRVRRRRW